MKIVECPRDALQGLEQFVPTALKIEYINLLLKVGFDTIDFGSFVSPKVIPQMRDTAEVLGSLVPSENTKLLAIVANLRGAEEACHWDSISYLGYPLSVSETFQKRNTNQTREMAFGVVNAIQEICQAQGKILVVYLSMGFGNPYGDPYSTGVVNEFVERLVELQIEIISLSDTIGVSTPENIERLFQGLSANHPQIEFGVHLHSRPDQAFDKLLAAWKAGCRRFDGALGGYGGCPMAADQLVGNIDTHQILKLLESQNVEFQHDPQSLEDAMRLVPQIFLAH